MRKRDGFIFCDTYVSIFYIGASSLIRQVKPGRRDLTTQTL